MNKRSAEKADLVVPDEQQPRRPRRSTRSTARQAELERQRQEEEAELEEARLQRAMDLTATPVLQALPLLFVSGFLYKHEIRSVALASKSCHSIWVEAQDELPDYCQVEVKVDLYRSSWPRWAKIRGLQHVIPGQDFCRTIFQKLCDLKIAAEPSKRKKEKLRATLPKWGVDFLGIRMMVWGPTSHNDGGIHFTLNKFSATQSLFLARNGAMFPREKLRGWTVRIDDFLILWTWDQFRKWKKVYDWQPLWDSELLDDDDVSVDDEEPEVPAPPVVVAPPPLPPPGPGRIDFYFQPRAS